MKKKKKNKNRFLYTYTKVISTIPNSDLGKKEAKIKQKIVFLGDIPFQCKNHLSFVFILFSI